MLSFLFIILAAICNAVMDVLFTRYNSSVFFRLMNPHFWNPHKSWINKWAQPYPPFTERFRFSSTLLVFLTDGWHLFKAFMIAFFILSVVNYTPIFNLWVDAVMLYSTFTGTFTLFYNNILRL